MNRHAWIVVLIGLTGASCAVAPRPRLGMAVEPMSSAARPAQRAAADPLRLEVYPRITGADGRASVRVRVEPSVLSRSLELSWWSDGIGGTHLITLNGDQSARRYDMPIKRLDPGHYEVTAVLMRADGTRIRRTTSILVVGR